MVLKLIKDLEKKCILGKKINENEKKGIWKKIKKIIFHSN